MEQRAVRLAGSEIHGFHTWEDLEVEKMMEEAASRWLRPNEIHAILYNHHLFTILVKPVNLPNGGTVVLFDRKMLRNFRRDGHNWKKKKDGKTVKEAHEHLKVGNEERIHVYYAHGLDNPGFVRRCYWLLDKKHEHIVLVHYRETLEVQGSPVAPVPTNSGSAQSDTYSPTTRILQEEVDHQANHPVYSGSGISPVSNSIQVDDSTTVSTHAKKLYEINTLEWDDLLGLSDPNDCTPVKDNISSAEPWNQYKINDPKNNSSPINYYSPSQTSLLPPNNIHGGMPSFGHLTNAIVSNASTDVKLPTSGSFQNKGAQTHSNVPREHFELVNNGTDGSLGMVKDGLQTQDSFGRWMNYIMADSPDSLDGLPVESSSSTGDGSSLSAGTDQHQSSNQQQIFSITDISPGWAFSTEETKVIVIGYFHGGQTQLADSNLVIVLGDQCLPAEMVQNGVFRCMALPHSPGLVNLYLSLDGHTPISQVMSFEYRSPSIGNGGVSPKEKSDWEEFQVELRLAHLLFSDTNSLAILSSKVSPSHVKEAKKFVQATSSIVQDWDYFIESIGKSEISYPQAQRNLFLITLKNKLQEWLLERVIEGSKTSARDRQGQGIIHLCAILGYTWAVRPYSRSGLSLDFRDAHGWTALHWAAHYGREKMAATLLTAGANPSLVSDPSTEFPGGCTCADLASNSGYDGLAAYLAEKGLTEHFNRMSLSGNISGSLQKNTTDYEYYDNLNEEEICQKDSLTAYRTAADAAARIQTAFRENALKLRKKAAQLANPEVEARNIVSAMKIQHAFRNYKSRRRMQAAARIQYTFRTRKIRNEFLNMRRQAIRIQAVFRGHQVRKEYRKIIWSVGVLEKAILRWRRMRKGFRGLQVEPPMVDVVDPKEENTAEEDFFVISRKQAEERVERSVVKVQALFRSYKAQQEYRRMKQAIDQAQMDDLFET